MVVTAGASRGGTAVLVVIGVVRDWQAALIVISAHSVGGSFNFPVSAANDRLSLGKKAFTAVTDWTLSLFPINWFHQNRLDTSNSFSWYSFHTLYISLLAQFRKTPIESMIICSFFFFAQR